MAGEYCAGTKLDPAETLADWHTEFGTNGRMSFASPSAATPVRKVIKDEWSYTSCCRVRRR
jgi:hypothetical protein